MSTNNNIEDSIFMNPQFKSRRIDNSKKSNGMFGLDFHKREPISLKGYHLAQLLEGKKITSSKSVYLEAKYELDHRKPFSQNYFENYGENSPTDKFIQFVEKTFGSIEGAVGKEFIVYVDDVFRKSEQRTFSEITQYIEYTDENFADCGLTWAEE